MYSGANVAICLRSPDLFFSFGGRKTGVCLCVNEHMYAMEDLEVLLRENFISEPIFRKSKKNGDASESRSWCVVLSGPFVSLLLLLGLAAIPFAASSAAASARHLEGSRRNLVAHLRLKVIKAEAERLMEGGAPPTDAEATCMHVHTCTRPKNVFVCVCVCCKMPAPHCWPDPRARRENDVSP